MPHRCWQIPDFKVESGVHNLHSLSNPNKRDTKRMNISMRWVCPQTIEAVTMIPCVHPPDGVGTDGGESCLVCVIVHKRHDEMGEEKMGC